MMEICNSYLAVDIGGTVIKCGLISEHYEVLDRIEFQRPTDDLNVLLSCIDRAIESWKGRFCGIGISLHGPVINDHNGNQICTGEAEYMKNLPFAKIMSDRYGVVCAMENDGNCIVMGEYANGALKGCNCGVAIGLGTAIAGGIIVNGELLKGAHSFSGEFSFMYYNRNLNVVDGILAFNAGANILRKNVIRRKNLPDNIKINGYDIFAMAREGDEQVIEAIREYAKIIAQLIWDVQAIIDPEVIAIAGGISEQPLLLQLIQEEYDKLSDLFVHSPYPCPPHANIVVAKYNKNANLIGAVYNCRKRFEK